MNYEHDPDQFDRKKKILEASIKAGLMPHEVGTQFVGIGAISFLNALTGHKHPFQAARAAGEQIHRFLQNPQMLEQFKANVANARQNATQVRRPGAPVSSDATGRPHDLLKESKS